jgi:hypothetical protein
MRRLRLATLVFFRIEMAERCHRLPCGSLSGEGERKWDDYKGGMVVEGKWKVRAAWRR